LKLRRAKQLSGTEAAAGVAASQTARTKKPGETALDAVGRM